MNQQPNLEQELEKFFNEFKNKFKLIIPIVIGILVLAGGSSSFYTVEPDEEAIVVRLGKYIGTFSPGLHFKIPFGIDKHIKIKTKKVHQEEFGFRGGRSVRYKSRYETPDTYKNESLMLTGDLNVADVEWVVQYQISNPYKFIFKTSSPRRNVRDISESIMRRVVGDKLVTEVLTTGRVEIATDAKILMQEVLDQYDMGVSIVTVKLQDVNPPDSVKPSFNEVNEAKQEQEKMINQAEEAYNKVIPEAKGKAEKLLSEAEGYAEAIVNRSLGDAKKFTSVFNAYKKAPKITRKRLYLETMEEVFSNLKDITLIDPKVKGLLPVFNNMNLNTK